MAITASRNRALPLAIGLATVTTYMTYRFLRAAGPLAPARPVAQATVKAVVPVVDVPARRPLRATMFAVRSFQADAVPKDAVSTLAELDGKVSRTALHAGQPIARADTVARSAELGLAFAVRPPRRAVTVALDPVIGVNGFPKPGDRVDVLASFTTPDGMVTRTVLEDVEILAYGAEVQAGAAAPAGKPAGSDAKSQPAANGSSDSKPQTTATLAVLPAEAERLILAESRGKLRLALRAVDDTSHGKTAGISEAQLTGVPVNQKPPAAPTVVSRPAPAKASQPKPRPAAAPAPHRILVVRGSEREVVQVSRLASGAGRRQGSEAAVAVAQVPAVAVDKVATQPAGEAPAAQAATPPVQSTDAAPAAKEMAARPASEGGVR